MADKWRTATGNWSTAAEWNDSTLPGTGDDAYADGYTCTIDTNITVVKISTQQRTGGTAGGGFAASTTRTVTANIVCGTTTCLTWSGGASAEVLNVNGSIYGSTTTTTTYALQITTSGSTVNVVGDVYGGVGNISRWGIYVNLSVTATINVTGSLLATSSGICVGLNGPTTLAIEGNLQTSAAGRCVSYVSTNAAGTSITVTGDVFTSGTSTGDALFLTMTGITNCTVSITGNVYSGSIGSGVEVTVGHTITITGDVSGSSYSTIAYGVDITTSTLTVNGNVYGRFGAGIDATSGLITVNGNVYGNDSGGTDTGNGIEGGNNVVVNGNVYGGHSSNTTAATTCVGINLSSNTAGTVVVTGDVYGGYQPGRCGISYIACRNHHVRVNGNLITPAGGSMAVVCSGQLSMGSPETRTIDVLEGDTTFPNLTGTVVTMHGIASSPTGVSPLVNVIGG